MKYYPILVILDACSHLILAIELSKDRTGERWNTEKPQKGINSNNLDDCLSCPAESVLH